MYRDSELHIQLASENGSPSLPSFPSLPPSHPPPLPPPSFPQGLNVEAAGFYESTLQYQPEFQPAADRLKIVRCLILAAKKPKKPKDKEIEQN